MQIYDWLNKTGETILRILTKTYGRMKWQYLKLAWKKNCWYRGRNGEYRKLYLLIRFILYLINFGDVIQRVPLTEYYFRWIKLPQKKCWVVIVKFTKQGKSHSWFFSFQTTCYKTHILHQTSSFFDQYSTNFKRLFNIFKKRRKRW